MNTKKTLLFAAIALMPALSFAQGSFQLGIKGGVNLSKFSFGSDIVTTRLNANGSPAVGVNGQQIRDNLRESLNSRTGTAFGVYARFGKNLYIQPEVLYSTKASSFDIIRTENGQTQTQTVNVSTTSFDVPVLLGLKGGPIRVVAGPVVSFRIADNQQFRDALQQYTTGSLNDAWAKAYYGYQIGGGLDLGRLGIDVRREGSFSDIAAVKLGTDNQAQFNQKLRSWQVTLAYRIF
ncbi:MAG: PorT family protein [Cytophagales bacterium]|nr:MAG: PorT family protein [Cytophagales bacterium]